MMNVPVVCDYGSGFSKVGFSGTEAPLAMFPTILGKPVEAQSQQEHSSPEAGPQACLLQGSQMHMVIESPLLGTPGWLGG